MQRVRSKRNQKRGSRSVNVSLAAMGRRLVRHVKKHPAAYAPAVAPVLLLLCAHVISIPAHMVLKTAGLMQYQNVFDSMLTWGVYGFLPLVLVSYAAFHGVARPVASLLARKWPAMSATMFGLAPGAAYGVVAGIGFLALLRPGSEVGTLLLLLFCLLTGIVNWLFYRKMGGVAAVPVDA